MWTSAEHSCQTQVRRHWSLSSMQVSSFGSLGDHTSADLYAQYQAADLPETNAILLELIRLAQLRHGPATDFLLYAFLPRALRLARGTVGLRRHDVRDARDIAVAAVWEAIQLFPLDTTCTSVAFNLGARTLSIITRTETKLAIAPEDAAPDEALEAALGPVAANDSSTRELQEVLRWARESRCLTADEIRLLTAYELGEKQSRLDLATVEGLSAAALTKRVQRIRYKLRDGVRAHIVEHGRW